MGRSRARGRLLATQAPVAPRAPRTQLLRKRRGRGLRPPGNPVLSGGTAGRAWSSWGVTARGGVPGTHRANARHAHVRVQARLPTEPAVPLSGGVPLPSRHSPGCPGADALTVGASNSHRGPTSGQKRPLWAGPGRRVPVSLPQSRHLKGWTCGDRDTGAQHRGSCFGPAHGHGRSQDPARGGDTGLETARPSGPGTAWGTRPPLRTPAGCPRLRDDPRWAPPALN